MSDIFDRLKLVQPYLAKTQGELAEFFGVDEKTFGGVLRRKSNNIYPLLPKLFERLPDLNAEWLYLGKGVPRKSEEAGAEPQSYQELVEANRRLVETNQQLVEQNQRLSDRNQALVDQLLKQSLK